VHSDNSFWARWSPRGGRPSQNPLRAVSRQSAGAVAWADSDPGQWFA